MAASPPPLALRQLQLDTAVAAEGFVGALGIDRLEFTEAGGNQALGRYPFAHEILHDRDGAARRQVPVRTEDGTGGRSDIGVAVDPQHPGNLTGNLALKLDNRRRDLVELIAAFRLEDRLPGIEEHLRLE